MKIFHFFHLLPAANGVVKIMFPIMFVTVFKGMGIWPWVLSVYASALLPRTCSDLFNLESNVQGPSLDPLDMFRLVQLGSHYTGPGPEPFRHIQTYLL